MLFAQRLVINAKGFRDQSDAGTRRPNTTSSRLKRGSFCTKTPVPDAAVSTVQSLYLTLHNPGSSFFALKVLTVSCDVLKKKEILTVIKISQKIPGKAEDIKM